MLMTLPDVFLDEHSSIGASKIALYGENLESKTVSELESKLKVNGQDTISRLKLLGYYYSRNLESRSIASRVRHICWFIEQRPDHQILNSPYGIFERSRSYRAYLKIRRKWLSVVPCTGVTRALSNAASFFICNGELDSAKEVFTLAQSLEPANPDWYRGLARVQTLIAESGDQKQWESALEYYQMAQELAGNTLVDAASISKVAFDAAHWDLARSSANDILSRVKAGTCVLSESSFLLHTAHITLGKLAIREGNIAEAQRELENAVSIPYSLLLTIKGLDTTLPAALLKLGETECVLQYLQRCKLLWKNEHELLERWTQDVQSGRTPHAWYL